MTLFELMIILGYKYKLLVRLIILKQPKKFYFLSDKYFDLSLSLFCLYLAVSKCVYPIGRILIYYIYYYILVLFSCFYTLLFLQ